ncbi:hypothetical protein ACWGB8_24725 [Kitasatospora sp. NPDC054939]
MSSIPHYTMGDLLQEEADPERRHLVLDIGSEAYFLRVVSGQGPVEPLESTWAIASCEEATARVAHPWPTDPGLGHH